MLDATDQFLTGTRIGLVQQVLGHVEEEQVSLVQFTKEGEVVQNAAACCWPIQLAA